MITWNPTDMSDAASDTLAVHDLLARFFQAFDDHDWSMMRSCLCDELFVIYSSDQKVPASMISAERYVDQRRGALKGFVMQHNFFNLRVELDAAGRSATARCNYVIHRFHPTVDDTRDQYCHSYGHYVFGFVNHSGIWRITRIAQCLLRHEGNRESSR
jgi:hypothetical protein